MKLQSIQMNVTTKVNFEDISQKLSVILQLMYLGNTEY
jgi:hypothetical protein